MSPVQRLPSRVTGRDTLVFVALLAVAIALAACSLSRPSPVKRTFLLSVVPLAALILTAGTARADDDAPAAVTHLNARVHRRLLHRPRRRPEIVHDRVTSGGSLRTE